MSFSASQAERAIACPGSVVLAAKLQSPPSSVHAEEGKQAHKLVELILKGKAKDIDAYPDEIRYHATNFISILVGKCLDEGITHGPFPEVKVRYPGLKDGTVDTFFYNEDTLYVYDFKYGAGLPVPVKENPQLLIYALSIIQTLRLKFKKVVVGIYQPRITEELMEWDATASILPFVDTINNTLIDISSESPSFSAGPQCRFCPASGKCKTQIENIEKAFNIDLSKGSVMPQLPSVELMTEEEMSRYLNHAEDLQIWLNAVKSEALKTMMAGGQVPGYTWTQGMGNREWTDEGYIEKHFGEKYGEKIYNKKLKSPAQMEKTPGITKIEVQECTSRKPTKPILKKLDEGKSNLELFDLFGD